MPAFKERDAAPDLAKLYYTGHFSLQTKTAAGLEDLLADYFEVPVAIEEFRGSWVEIPESEWLRMGESEATGTLGVSAIVGSRVWDQQLKFRAVCGPMGFEDYERLLPSSPSLPRMSALIRSYIGDELIWDLQLILVREEIPEIQLGSAGRLGWTTWLINEAPTEDADDFVIESERIPVSVPAAPQVLGVV
jgi:type VI secretion system protein ImpH